MGTGGGNSATLPREREQAPAWAPEWPEWLDELLEDPDEAGGEPVFTSAGDSARSFPPDLPAPDRPEWLDFSGYLEAVPHPAPTAHRRQGDAPSEQPARSPRDSRAARFARIAREIRASWEGETTAYATGVHPVAHAERARQTAAPAATAIPRCTPALAPRRTPAPVPRPGAPSSARRRAAQVSRRLAELAVSRVVVRIPGRIPRRKSTAAATGVGNEMRVAKLAPVWLLANLLILLLAGWAILPRLAGLTSQSACAWHVVVPGDTLGNLGAAHHTSALAIARANTIPDPDQIYVGERLCIPLAFFASAGAAAIIPAPPPSPPHYGPVSGVHAFISFALPYARRASAATGWPTSLILAQWGLEHGWHLPGYTGYNFGNCGAVPGEATIGGLNVPGSPAAFTYSKTPEDGLRVYIHVAHLSFYTGVAWAAQHGGVDAAARALGRSPWDAGHYTDHNDPGSSLLAILHAYNLYQYDAN